MCVECGEGSFYNKVTKNCELCPLNFYGDASKQCLPCPDNKVTLQRGSSRVSNCVLNCTVGHMLNETINQCVPCPHNFYQDQPGKHYCLPCPPSHGTNTNGTAQFAACTEFCPPGTQRNNSGLCEPCPRGSYRVGDKEDQCSFCPVDLTTADTGHDRESDCIIPICPPGMFANSTNATNYTCVPCEIGYYQPDNASISCIPCSDNYTTVTTGSYNIIQCLFYCEAGFEESPLDSKNCKPCQRGFYRPGDIFNRFLNCSQCQHGLTTDEEKSVSQSDCNIKICSSGNVLSSNLSICQPCPHDTYQPLDQPNSTTVCLSCTSGHGTVNVASNSSTDCKLFCQPGNGSGNSGSCEECKQGFWNNGNSSMRFEPCQKCPVNYTTEGAGATDVNNCSLRDCPSGTYIKGQDCISCELGTYQPLPHQTQCNNCRANTSTSSIASTSPDDCTIECPAGNEGNASDNCSPCGDDEYKSEENYGLCQNCTGDFTSEPNNRTHCTIVHCNYGREYSNGNCSDCTKGYYKEVRGNVNCMKCPGNTSTAGQGSTSLSHCNITYCEPGFFSAHNSTCMACPIGFYKNETGNQECTLCPENLTSSGVGSTHIANCSLRLCPVGYHRLNDSFCSPCGIGEYQNETGQIECKKCPLINNLNSTTFNTTSTNISDCYPVCGPGHFLDMTAKVCTQCPYGNYKNTTDLNTTCQKCPSNFTTTNTGATSELQCEYIICGKGEYRPNNAQSKCLKCPIGTYKAVSTYEPTNCTQCQTNYTTLIEGATSMENYCILNCPGGEQYNSLLEKNCTPCPVGQFKENSTVLNVCKYCAANLTTLTSGATSCIQSSASPPAEINITITVYIDINLGSCDNQLHLKSFIHEIITSVVKTARKNKFPGLCPTDACDNMIYVILEICGNPGKKRQTSQTARVKLDLKDIASPLAYLDGTKRNTERAVAELFWFDTLPFEDRMMSNAVTITNVTVQVVCPEGYSYNTVQWHCIQCTAGKYVNKAQCEDCPKGSYSTNPPSNICEQCPEHQTTNKTGSDNVSDCKGVCYFDNSYCGGSGQCQVNSATGIHECKCNENYQGFQCAERYSSENKDTMNIVVGISVALGVLLFIVLLTLALCIKRNRKKSKKSTASDTDYLSQRTPDFNQPVMFQNPAMFNDPTLYNGDVMEFYDHDPSVYRKSSGLSDAYLANRSRLSVHSRQREYTP